MRDIKQLCPELQAVIPAFLSDCKSKGLNVGIGECYRTVEEQENLYAIGRTVGTKGAIVTNCRGVSYSSPHQWGVAFDFFRNVRGREFDDSDNFFAKVGAIGKAHGLEWGGSWTQGWVDKPHLQLAKFFRDGTTGYLKKTYGSPAKFMATWKPVNPVVFHSDTTNPVTVKHGSAYQAKFTCAKAPVVTAPTGGVVDIKLAAVSGNDYFYKFTATGKPKSGTGICVDGKRIFVINVE